MKLKNLNFNSLNMTWYVYKARARAGKPQKDSRKNWLFLSFKKLLFWFIYLFEVQVQIYKLDSFSISASLNLGINVYIKLIAHGFRNAKLKCDSEEKTTTELNKMPL